MFDLLHHFYDFSNRLFLMSTPLGTLVGHTIGNTLPLSTAALRCTLVLNHGDWLFKYLNIYCSAVVLGCIRLYRCSPWTVYTSPLCGSLHWTTANQFCLFQLQLKASRQLVQVMRRWWRQWWRWSIHPPLPQFGLRACTSVCLCDVCGVKTKLVGIWVESQGRTGGNWAEHIPLKSQYR